MKPWQSLSSNVQRNYRQPIGCFIIIDLPLRVWTDTRKASNKSINYWCSRTKLIVDDKDKIGKERWQFLEEGWLDSLTKTYAVTNVCPVSNPAHICLMPFDN